MRVKRVDVVARQVEDLLLRRGEVQELFFLLEVARLDGVLVRVAQDVARVLGLLLVPSRGKLELGLRLVDAGLA